MKMAVFAVSERPEHALRQFDTSCVLNSRQHVRHPRQVMEFHPQDFGHIPTDRWTRNSQRLGESSRREMTVYIDLRSNNSIKTFIGLSSGACHIIEIGSSPLCFADPK
jgi:hypothetical protein